MEVEVKIRLPDSISHQKLSSLLSPFHTKTLLQENVFFDGSNSELSTNLAVLRLRFSNNTHCFLSLKSQPVISHGISRAQELEETLDTTLARACIAEPWRLLLVNSSEIIKRVKEEFGVGEKGLACLGGFRNLRAVYEWEGLKLEVDETYYDFGTSYEVECESSNPERDKKVIERFLEENEIGYEYSEVSKFAVFWSGKLTKKGVRIEEQTQVEERLQPVDVQAVNEDDVEDPSQQRRVSTRAKKRSSRLRDFV